MHRTAFAALISLVAIASPARAEFPAALSAWGGLGHGWGSRQDFASSEVYGLAGVEAAWRFAPGRALVATFESGGSLGGTMKITAPSASGGSSLESFDHIAVTVGPEFSFPPGSGAAAFFRGSAGMGRATTNGHQLVQIYTGGASPPARLVETGFALSGAVGYRAVPRPGPVGFVFAIHAAQTWTRHSRCGGFGATFGLTIYPLDARSGP